MIDVKLLWEIVTFLVGQEHTWLSLKETVDSMRTFVYRTWIIYRPKMSMMFVGENLRAFEGKRSLTGKYELLEILTGGFQLQKKNRSCSSAWHGSQWFVCVNCTPKTKTYGCPRNLRIKIFWWSFDKLWHSYFLENLVKVISFVLEYLQRTCSKN